MSSRRLSPPPTERSDERAAPRRRRGDVMLEVVAARASAAGVATHDSSLSKGRARLAGVLSILATVTVLIGGGLVDPVVGSGHRLAAARANRRAWRCCPAP